MTTGTAAPLISPSVQDWAHRCMRRMAEKHARSSEPSPRGRKLLVVHLDGIPHEVLQDAVRENRMPFLTRLIRSGAHRLDTAFWGTPASTPAFQGGLMYGLRHPGLPAYNWFDRETGRELKMNQPSDAALVERRLSEQASRPLFGEGGTSYLSIFHGAARNEVCMATLSDLKLLARGMKHEFRGLRSARREGVRSYLRSLFRETWDSAVEVSHWAREVQNWKHERAFFINRFLLLSLAWELGHSRTLIDMWKGVPAIYLVFSNFDEVAHRRGPQSTQALRELHRADRAFEELYAMSKLVPEPYDLFFVTDHGHVASEPFGLKEDARLEKYLFEGVPEPLPLDLERELLSLGGPTPQVLRAPRPPVVIEAGNFAHVYLASGPALEAMDLVAHHPSVLSRAIAAKNIGIVTLRAGGKGYAIIDNHVYSAGTVDQAPLSKAFSKQALADYLRELPHLPSAGDLVLYGQATGKNSTVGFAWEFGSHGGLTQTETDSTVIWPSDAALPFNGLMHSTELHSQLYELYRS